jgi:hypothetical protein
MRKLLVFTSAILLTGCGARTRVEDAATRYQAIQTINTSNQVVLSLGHPQNIDTNGFFHWRTEGATTNVFAELTVGFDATGRIWYLAFDHSSE